MKRIPFTKFGFDKLIAEKEHLIASRPEAVAELKRAREMGDLSENGAYKGARFKLSGIDRRLRELDHLIKEADIIVSAQIGIIDIGCTVTVHDGSETQTFSIVGSFESNPSEGTISHKSPIGRALLGKKKGEQIMITVPQGNISYTILDIR